jgi:hypothetical protein
MAVPFDNPIPTWLLAPIDCSKIPAKDYPDVQSTEFVNFLRSTGIDSKPGGIDSLETIPGLLKRLKIRALKGNGN